ncbi:hypothetical protein DPMN_149378 [Dreissena polymorpha]|uniref:Uncharacterized protein n=1 Tax=Dreissena polymorpha TaxID=45954 RepID=A0A9D4J591_DREPO|nr:hypothetical protein DPMN_149378 [Dreissena polymorpha]
MRVRTAAVVVATSVFPWQEATRSACALMDSPFNLGVSLVLHVCGVECYTLSSAHDFLCRV